MTQLTNICNQISPYRLIQCTKRYTPWIDKDFLQQTDLRDNLHKQAILTDDTEDWRLYRQQRNKCNRLNKDNKTKYYKNRLNKPDRNTNNVNDCDINDSNVNNNDWDQDNTNNDYCDYTDTTNKDKYSDRQMWKTIKDITNNNRRKPPRHILINNKMTTSLDKICNFSNQFFIDKIKKLRDIFKIN